MDVYAADGTSTSLTFHVVCAGLAKTLVATRHKRDTCIALSYEAYLAVVHVADWYGNGFDDGVCAGVSVMLFFIRRGVAVRVCGPITELAAVGAYVVTHCSQKLHAGVTVVIETA